MNKNEQSLLSGTELAYEFLQSRGIHVFGNRLGPFAVRSKSSDTLYVFGSDKGNVRNISFDDDIALLPFELAQIHGASFKIQDQVVHCQVGDVSATGSTYVEAAMRVLLIVRSAQINRQTP